MTFVLGRPRPSHPTCRVSNFFSSMGVDVSSADSSKILPSTSAPNLHRVYDLTAVLCTRTLPHCSPTIRRRAPLFEPQRAQAKSSRGHGRCLPVRRTARAPLGPKRVSPALPSPEKCGILSLQGNSPSILGYHEGFNESLACGRHHLLDPISYVPLLSALAPLSLPSNEPAPHLRMWFAGHLFPTYPLFPWLWSTFNTQGCKDTSYTAIFRCSDTQARSLRDTRAADTGTHSIHPPIRMRRYLCASARYMRTNSTHTYANQAKPKQSKPHLAKVHHTIPDNTTPHHTIPHATPRHTTPPIPCQTGAPANNYLHTQSSMSSDQQGNKQQPGLDQSAGCRGRSRCCPLLGRLPWRSLCCQGSWCHSQSRSTVPTSHLIVSRRSHPVVPYLITPQCHT